MVSPVTHLPLLLFSSFQHLVQEQLRITPALTTLPTWGWCGATVPYDTPQLMGLLVSHSSMLWSPALELSWYCNQGKGETNLTSFTFLLLLLPLQSFLLSPDSTFSAYHCQEASSSSGEAVVPGARKPSVGEGTESRRLSPLQLLCATLPHK